MSEIDVWRGYAKRLGFPRPEHAEKDYLQDLLLAEIFSSTNDLVFRGGTAISKFYGSGRFSTDLDFTTRRKTTSQLSKTVELAIKNMNNYYRVEYHSEKYREMLFFEIIVYGPLYLASSNESAKQRIEIDINVYEKAFQKTETVLRTPVYSQARPYFAVVESAEELLADKVKAAIERKEGKKVVSVRDVYDMWILIKKYALDFDFKLIKNKMKYYGIKSFSIEDLQACVKQSKKAWDLELSSVMNVYPEYEAVASDLLKIISSSKRAEFKRAAGGLTDFIKKKC